MKIGKVAEALAGLGLMAAGAGLILSPIPGDEIAVGGAGLLLFMDAFGKAPKL